MKKRFLHSKLLLIVSFCGMPISAGLVDVDVKKASANIDCYKNVNIDANVGERGTLQIVTGNCDVVVIQKLGATGDIVNLTNLPTTEGVDKFTLGSIKDLKAINNISVPTPGKKVLFSLQPTIGQLKGKTVEFVIANIAPNKIENELRERKLTQQATELRKNHPNQNVELLSSIATCQKLAPWEDLGQTISVSGSIQDRFNFITLADAAAMIDNNKNDWVKLFDLGTWRLRSRNLKAELQTIKQNVQQKFGPLLKDKANRIKQILTK